MLKIIIGLALSVLLLNAGVVKEEELKLSAEDIEAYDSIPLSELLTSMANELSSTTPQKLDKYTTLSSVLSYDNTLTYIEILDVKRDTPEYLKMKDQLKHRKEYFANNMFRMTRNNVCSDPYMKYIFNRGAILDIDVRTIMGHNLFTVRVDNADCERTFMDKQMEMMKNGTIAKYTLELTKMLPIIIYEDKESGSKFSITRADPGDDEIYLSKVFLESKERQKRFMNKLEQNKKSFMDRDHSSICKNMEKSIIDKGIPFKTRYYFGSVDNNIIFVTTVDKNSCKQYLEKK